jgi:serine/threonine protein kinase
LFTALAAVHKHEILHRDIKPTNFLYDIHRRRGVLVDFGLAEREGTDCQPCICGASSGTRRAKIEANGSLAQSAPAQGYPKNDPRPSRRANRAGTRGFRAPEVLLKCTNQTSSKLPLSLPYSRVSTSLDICIPLLFPMLSMLTILRDRHLVHRHHPTNDPIATLPILQLRRRHRSPH